MTDLPVKSLKTTFEILEALVHQNGAGISALADSLDLPKSTIHDHLATLQELEYVVKRDGEYQVGMNILRIGDLTRQDLEIYQSSVAELDRLASETNEHVSLVVEEHGNAIIFATREGGEAVPVNIYDGIRMHMHTAAPGKAILAYLPDEHINAIVDEHGLPQLTENTITTRSGLSEELATIRERKYALDDEERLVGMRSVAVPVIDRYGTPRGALTIYGPTNRIDDALFRDEFPELLLQSGNIVEVLMNYE